jgi:hypothetical protein
MQEERAARLAADIQARFSPLISDSMRDFLALQVEQVIRSAVRDERRECEEVCRARSRLWQTCIASGPSSPLLVEAELRDKEALYLADAIGARDESE